ncbi:MAG: hypothetical protein QM692_14985 [Thermomicrobiales bacterium]
MDAHLFDAMTRAAGARRTVLGGALAAFAGGLALSGAEAKKKKRKKKCKAPKVKCGKQCLPAGACCTTAECGTCQVCTGNACVVAPAGSPCGVGGRCNGTSCVAEGSFGCTDAQDFCSGESPKTACPQSKIAGAFCVTLNGKPTCAVGGCIQEPTQQACDAAFGPGAVRPDFCSTCSLNSPGPNDPCFRPVTA